ncbi:MAG: ATP-binding domain-containing protein [Desulfobacteraceae bacterium]|nr:ATP-binding domain-containing protein [Desulfobacteraceae bacterium]
MEKNVNELILDKDLVAKNLITFLESHERELNLDDSYLYHCFPLYQDEDDSSASVNVLLLSRLHGVLLFECSEISTRTAINFSERIAALVDRSEQTFTQIYSRLIKSRLLRRGPRYLVFPVKQIALLPNLRSGQISHNDSLEYITILLKDSDVADYLNKSKIASIEDKTYREILAVLEGSKGITKPKNRNIKDSSFHTKGAITQKIELEIANFDKDQKRAALNIIDGPQRIRGLAGSGKTIILTWKIALIHLQDPDSEILYTYFTKSLYELIKRLITRFYRQYSEKDPDWKKVHIMHAWGGRNLPGVYSQTCIDNGVKPMTLNEAKSVGSNPFEEVCKNLLKYKLVKKYDYSIIDEAQDSPQSFYRLCLHITKNKRLIWGYDECQNIMDIEIQDTRKTFGKDPHGNHWVDFNKAPKGTRNDIVLHRCYRNPKEIIFYAFALGLGIYNNPLLQIPENNEHWADLGFNVIQGNSITNDQMTVERQEQNTPLVMNKYFQGQDPIKVKIFNDIDKECNFVAAKIVEDINSELLPEDILVISLDDRHVRTYFKKIEDILSDYRIDTFNLQTAPAINTKFVKNDCVTLSTVYKAKGNEAASVYVIGVDSPFVYKNSIIERNKIFTALTRAKGWVTITGLGENAELFYQEFQQAQKNYPYLRFAMPDRRSLKVFQRDLDDTQAEINRLERFVTELAEKQRVSVDTILAKISKTRKKG